jgi:RNA polymerase sigma factor (sigma-70 family)
MSIRRVQQPTLSVVGAACREASDTDLALALKSGNAWAIEETWNRFAPMVHVMAVRTLGVRAEAEDICQEVFHRVFRRAKTLREPSKLRYFISAFAVHVLRHELVRRKAHSWLSFHEPQDLAEMSASTLVDVESRDLLRRFYGLLDRLKPRDRLVYALRNFEHMTVDEIVTITNLSMSTVKRSLAHTTKKLSVWSESDLGIAAMLGGKGQVR